MSTDPDVSFWESVYPPTFLDDDRANPARVLAGAVVAAAFACGARSLVEVGPGPGWDIEDHFLRTINAGMSYLGIEPTANLRDALLERYADLPLSFVDGSFANLHADGFDVAYTKATFEHLPDFHPALERFVCSARMLAIVNWYRPPCDVEQRHYDAGQHVHYNTYKRGDVLASVAGVHRGLTVHAFPGGNEVWLFRRR